MSDELGFHVPLGPWCEEANERIRELEAEDELHGRAMMQLKKELEQAEARVVDLEAHGKTLIERLLKAEAEVATRDRMLGVAWEQQTKVRSENQWLADLRARAEQ